MKPSFLFIILLLFFMSNVFATNYYVNPDSGSDFNSGMSSNTAWQHITKVNSYNSYNPGDVISFKCGTRFYNQTLIPKIDDITFNSYGIGDRPVIDADSARISHSRFCLDMTNNQSNIIFEGLKFVNGWLSNINVFGASSYVTINNCSVDSAIQDSYIEAAPGMIYVGGPNETPPHHWTITNSSISYSLFGHGMYWDGCRNVRLENDIVDSNGANGIQIYTGNRSSSSPNMAD